MRVRVDRSARADDRLPPTAVSGREAIAGQRVEDDDGVVAGVVQRAPGAVGEGDVRQVPAELEIDRAEVGEAHHAVRRRPVGRDDMEMPAHVLVGRLVCGVVAVLAHGRSALASEWSFARAGEGADRIMVASG